MSCDGFPSRPFALALAFGLCVMASAAQAAFEDGLRAYDGGDYASAAREWRALAEACDPQAATALAGLYHDGLGVPRNERLAVHWYRIAAEGGGPVAQMNLGDLYAGGRGVTKDRVQAYFWLALAAKQGREWAAKRLSRLERRMTPQELQKAKSQVAAFRPARRKRCE